MDTIVIILAEVVSAALCFVLVRFMIKPYLYTGESRYIGLPLGFAFLGVSYVFMGLALFPNGFLLVEDMKWLQLFSQAYAFAFLAVTYYFSKRRFERNIRFLWQVVFSILVVSVISSYLIVFEPPVLALPSHKIVDEYFRAFNMVFASYISVHTLRTHALKPERRTIWVPLGYILLAFSQYSFLIWSLDSSFSAFAGAHVIRVAGLLVLLLVSYVTFSASENAKAESSVS